MKALVTGASSGIGRALAKELKQRGYEIAIAARRRPALEALAGEIGGATVLVADLSLPGEAEKLAARAMDALGGVDLLVNNAGVDMEGRQAELADDQKARAMFETNYWSPLALTRALLPQLKSLVNVTSIASITPLPHHGHYASTKAALAIATETLRMELAGKAHVLHVLPGPVETAMYDNVKASAPGLAEMMKRTPTGTPEELAVKIVNALDKKRERLIYPGSLSIIRRFPNLSLWVTQKLAPRFIAALSS